MPPDSALPFLEATQGKQRGGGRCGLLGLPADACARTFHGTFLEPFQLGATWNHKSAQRLVTIFFIAFSYCFSVLVFY